MATLLIAVAATISPLAASAQSQNELLLSVTFDGTEAYSPDPLDNPAVYPSPHTPGLDARADNGVVRTYDTFGIRMDWNINEDAATNALLEVTLPVGFTWAPPPAANPPDPDMFSGCLTDAHGVTPSSSISADQRTLACNVGDQEQGSNGTIFATVLAGGLLDADTVLLSATLKTDIDSVGVVDAMDDALIISAAPTGDWVKGEPEIIDAVSNGGVDGDVLIYPLTFTWTSGGRGSEPMNDAVPIQFFDHPWDLPNAVLATGLMPGGRTECGQYDGATVLASTGNWTCTAAGGAYPTVQVDIAGHDTSGQNGVVSLHGQIAY